MNGQPLDLLREFGTNSFVGMASIAKHILILCVVFESGPVKYFSWHRCQKSLEKWEGCRFFELLPENLHKRAWWLVKSLCCQLKRNVAHGISSRAAYNFGDSWLCFREDTDLMSCRSSVGSFLIVNMSSTGMQRLSSSLLLNRKNFVNPFDSTPPSFVSIGSWDIVIRLDAEMWYADVPMWKFCSTRSFTLIATVSSRCFRNLWKTSQEFKIWCWKEI